MGREAKRVALDFKWPLNKTWFGYTLGLRVRCGPCREYGDSDECPVCYGQEYTDPIVEVPEGKGWQMWETVSEGSPISPVFKTPEELARWLAHTKASACGGEGATYEQWFAMIQQGHAPSMVYTPQDGLRPGVVAAK